MKEKAAGTNFSEIASRYERDSLVQKSAAENLIGRLEIRRSDRILDLGCGAGNLTRKLRALTDGALVGVDASESMVGEAEQQRAGLAIAFRTMGAEDLADVEAFDVVFCNSVFQWFPDPGRVLANCFRALAPDGRLGIQAPATRNYCPNFLAATRAVAEDPRTAKRFAAFRAPWTFFDSAEAYGNLLERAGFTVDLAVIEEEVTHHAPEKVMAIFESGAAAGYLNEAYYPDKLERSYVETFREIVAESFRKQAGGDGLVALVFKRIYMIGRKKRHG